MYYHPIFIYVKRNSIIYKVSNEDFKKLLSKSESYSDLLRKCGLNSKGGNINTIKRRIKDMSLNDSHISKGKCHNKGRTFKQNRVSLEFAMSNIFVENSNKNRGFVKKLIIRHSLKKYECVKCLNDGSWNNNKLSLHLEHINGASNDNRLDNLCFLCPNCHSQTDTYSGKKTKYTYTEYDNMEFRNDCSVLRTRDICNKYLINISTLTKIKNRLGMIDENWRSRPLLKNRKVERPVKHELEILLTKHPLTEIGTKYNVSDNSIRKWCKNMDIKLPDFPRGYWIRRKMGKTHDQSLEKNKPRSPIRKITSDEIEICKSMLIEGKSVRCISDKIDWTHGSLTRNLLKLNMIKVDETGRYRPV